MKQRPPAPVIRDHVVSMPPRRVPSTCKQPPTISRLAPTLLGKHRKVNYVLGEKPPKKPPETPQLFIRGLGGGIKLDLDGVGIRLTKAAFLHWVPDDSLQLVGIHRGDVVLVEPTVRRMHNGNLVLLTLDGNTPFRRLRKEGRLWWADPVDGKSSEPMLLATCGIQGVAIGVIRLFNELRPQKYERSDATDDAGFEIPCPEKPGRKQVLSKKSRPATDQPASGGRIKRLFPLPPVGSVAKFRLNDADKENLYKGRPVKR